MAQKYAGFIVDRHRWVIAVFLLLCAVCVFTVGRVNINYDLTEYLNENTMTRKSLDLMNREFGVTETMTILLSGLQDGTAQELADEISKMEGVMYALYDSDTDLRYKNGTRYERISLYLDIPDSLAFTDDLNIFLSGRSDVNWFALNGDAPQTKDVMNALYREIPVVMLIAIAVVIGVLFLTSHSYFEPALFSMVLIASILINMGTNFVFGSISFITFAVCAILQLALAMDYSIMLLHSYFEIRDSGTDDITAIKLALTRSIMPISSSSLTTIAGLVSLMFMSFTIGFDIGIVLSKGILISMLSVFTLMPALIVVFARPLRTTMHKPIPIGGNTLGRFASSKAARIIVPVVLIGCIAWAAVNQSRIQYTFIDIDVDASYDLLSDVFGKNNSVALIVPSSDSDEDLEKQRALIRDLKALTIDGRPAVTDVTGLVTTGEAAVRYYTPEDISELLGINRYLAAGYFGILGEGGNVRGDRLITSAAALMPGNTEIVRLKKLSDFAKQMFLTETCSRIILQIDAPSQSEDTERLIDEMLSLLTAYYPDGETGLTGRIMSVYDISNAFHADLLRVSLITIGMIFVIILISFKSVLIPFILLLAIQGAAWINTSLAVPAGRPLFFMSYLICLAIQMGATIDYGILLTSHYVRARKTSDKEEAIKGALKQSLPTVFTSGLILFAAGLAIGLECSVMYISLIGLLISSGAFFSMLMVLLLLPALLMNLDRWIVRKKKSSDQILSETNEF